MLQFIAKTNDKYSIPEQVQMAIEGGCSWVVLDVPECSDEEIRELSGEIVPLCKETATILTIVDHIELAAELHIHGVLLTDRSKRPSEVREQLGPDAILGVEVGVAAAAMAIKSVDIDYISFTPDMPISALNENVEALRQAGFMLNIVASGTYPIVDIPKLMQTGVNGVALSKAIADAADPVEATAEILDILKK